jgi:uncharacterized protein
MGRIIELLAFFMLAYFTIKSWLKGPPAAPGAKERPAAPAKPDYQDAGEMKQDPVCGTYVEAESALFVVHEERKVWFCSEECRDKYLKGLKG